MSVLHQVSLAVLALFSTQYACAQNIFIDTKVKVISIDWSKAINDPNNSFWMNTTIFNSDHVNYNGDWTDADRSLLLSAIRPASWQKELRWMLEEIKKDNNVNSAFKNIKVEYVTNIHQIGSTDYFHLFKISKTANTLWKFKFEENPVTIEQDFFLMIPSLYAELEIE